MDTATITRTAYSTGSRAVDPFATAVADTGVLTPMTTTYCGGDDGSVTWYRRDFGLGAGNDLVPLCGGYPATCRLDAGHDGPCDAGMRPDEYGPLF